MYKTNLDLKANVKVERAVYVKWLGLLAATVIALSSFVRNKIYVHLIRILSFSFLPLLFCVSPATRKRLPLFLSFV